MFFKTCIFAFLAIHFLADAAPASSTPRSKAKDDAKYYTKILQNGGKAASDLIFSKFHTVKQLVDPNLFYRALAQARADEAAAGDVLDKHNLPPALKAQADEYIRILQNGGEDAIDLFLYEIDLVKQLVDTAIIRQGIYKLQADGASAVAAPAA